MAAAAAVAMGLRYAHCGNTVGEAGFERRFEAAIGDVMIEGLAELTGY
jgi:hypothetical protein